jgi:hypothetical protein
VKKTLLAGIAALLLATGTVMAMDEFGPMPPDWWKPGLPYRPPHPPKPHWELDCRSTRIYSNDADALRGALTIEDIREVEKLIPYAKKCDAFWTCVWRRGVKDADGKWLDIPGPPKPGAPKHCYAPRGPNGKRLYT